MPEQRGKGLLMSAYVDADHTRDSVTRKLQTGFLAYLSTIITHLLAFKETKIS